MLFSVKIIPLILGTIFNMGLGAMWYSPMMFAKPWMEESGVTQENIDSTQDKMGQIYGATGVMALVTSYAIGFLVTNLSLGISGAIILGAVIWLGMDLPMVIKNWGFEDRTIKLGLINHGYQLVVYLVVGIIYTFF